MKNLYVFFLCLFLSGILFAAADDRSGVGSGEDADLAVSSDVGSHRRIGDDGRGVRLEEDSDEDGASVSDVELKQRIAVLEVQFRMQHDQLVKLANSKQTNCIVTCCVIS